MGFHDGIPISMGFHDGRPIFPWDFIMEYSWDILANLYTNSGGSRLRGKSWDIPKSSHEPFLSSLGGFSSPAVMTGLDTSW